MMGQSFASLVPTVTAAKSAIGLAIFVITFQVRGTIAVEFINSIQGFIIFSRKILGKTFKETPAGSGVVVLAKTALRDVVTSASVDVMNWWAVPSSLVSTRNRWELGSTLPFLIFFFYFILLAELVYAKEPANNPGEYEALVREHLAQAIDRRYRQEIMKSKGVEIGILERKGILQNQLLVLMRNEKNIL
nr:NADH dehydrogenase subunit 4L, mitochondrial [Tanacetum cinerariifolium]